MATTKKTGILALVFLLAVAGLFAWRLSAPVRQGPTTTSANTPVRGGELIASFRSPFTVYNRYVDPRAPGDLLALLTHAPLVRVDRTTDVLEPWLAERWTESDDGVTFTLTLRQGVTFSDGAPFTSADALFSFQALYDPRTPDALSGAIRVNGKPLRVEAPDAATLIIRFPEPFAPGLRLLDSLPILPRHKLGPALAQGTFAQAWGAQTPVQELAGLGPFVVAGHVPGERMVLTRNPRYWRTDANGIQLPYLDKLTIVIIPDQNTEALRAGAAEVDLMSNGDIRPEDYASFKRAEDAGSIRLIEAGTGLDPNLLWFNLSSTASRDPRHAWLGTAAFRHAVSCAIDRQAIANTIYLGAAVPIYGPVSPGNKTWHTPPANPCAHDLTRARTLLASVGLIDRTGDGMLEDTAGQPARFSVLTQKNHTIRERTASMIQQHLREVGIAVDVVTLDPDGLFARYGKGDYDAIYYGVQSSSTDPGLNMQFWLSSGFVHFWNPSQPAPATPWEKKIDDLMRQQTAARDMDERRRLFLEVQRVFEEQLPGIYLVAPRTILAVSSRVVNPRPALQIPQLLWSADTLASTQAGR